MVVAVRERAVAVMERVAEATEMEVGTAVVAVEMDMAAEVTAAEARVGVVREAATVRTA